MSKIFQEVKLRFTVRYEDDPDPDSKQEILGCETPGDLIDFIALEIYSYDYRMAAEEVYEVMAQIIEESL